MYEYNLAIRFESVVSQHGDRTAIWFGKDEQVTYAELNQTANRIARFLLARGVKQGDVVAISGEKSVVAFASMLASLKLGCPYVILDPDSPQERLRKILATCQPAVLLPEELASSIADLDADNLSETRSVTG